METRTNTRTQKAAKLQNINLNFKKSNRDSKCKYLYATIQLLIIIILETSSDHSKKKNTK